MAWREASTYLQQQQGFVLFPRIKPHCQIKNRAVNIRAGDHDERDKARIGKGN
jgi:hypothetical protein